MMHYQRGNRCKLLGDVYQSGWASCLSFAVPRVRYALSESRSLGVERKAGGKLHLKLKICLRSIANKCHEGKDAKDFEKIVRNAWNGWKVSELDQFFFVRLAPGACIHVSVCVVACFVCENQFTCELNFFASVALTISVFTHLGIYKWTAFKRQVIEVTVHCCCSILGVRLWLHGLVRPVLKHGRKSLTCVQVFGCQSCKSKKVNAWLCALATDGDLESGLSKSISVRNRKMVNHAWEGQSQGKLWWRLVAILTCKSSIVLGSRSERRIEPSSSWFPPKFLSG